MVLKWVWKAIGLIVVIVAILAVVAVIKYLTRPKPGSVKDEAMRAGLAAKNLPGSDDDYLRAMDRGWDKDKVFDALAEALKIAPAELATRLSKEAAWESYNRGRNNWVVWTAGNDTLWDFLGQQHLRRLRSVEDPFLPSGHQILRQ